MKKPTVSSKASKASKPQAPQTANAHGDDGTLTITSWITVLGVLHQGDQLHLVIVPKGANLERAVQIPAAHLAASATSLLEKLLLERQLGFLLGQLTAKEVSSQLRQFLMETNSIVICTAGHHKLSINGKAREVLVHGGRCTWLDSQPLDTKVTLIGEAAQTANPEKSLDDFNEIMTPILSVSDRLMTVLLFALAALMVVRLGLPPLVALLVGQSSIGKTIIQRAVAWWVNGDGHVRMFNGTPKGLQKHLHTLPAKAVFFEDSHGEDNAKAVANLIMAVGNAAEQRLTALPGDNQSATKIQASLVLSAEEGLSTSMRRAGVAMHSGINARVFEIHARHFGMLDDLCGHSSSASLAEFIDDAGPPHAGVVGAAFVAAMASDWDTLPKFWLKYQDKYRRKIKEAAGVEELDGINSRLLDRLAVAAFAGEFAMRRGVLRLETVQIYAALGRLFREHLDRQGVGKTPVAQAVVDAVRHFLQVNPSKFDPIEQAQSERGRNGLAGYQKHSRNGELLYLFFPESFKQVVPKGTEDAALEILDEAGYLTHTASRGLYLQVRFRPFGSSKEAPRLSVDFVAVRASIFGTES